MYIILCVLYMYIAYVRACIYIYIYIYITVCAKVKYWYIPKFDITHGMSEYFTQYIDAMIDL